MIKTSNILLSFLVTLMLADPGMAAFFSGGDRGTSPRRIVLDYVPLPVQELFHRTAANEVLFGGAAGGSKSHALLMEPFIYCQRIPGLQAYLFRRTYPELEKSHILKSLVLFPQGVGTYKENKHRWEFNNGSMLHFCHCQREKDVFQYQSTEMHWLGLDESTSFTEFMYDFLRARVRCTLRIPDQYRHKIPGIALATNPGGVGHVFHKHRWVDAAPPLTLHRAPDNEGGMLRIFIPARVQDNTILMERDPGYIKKLMALAEPYRSAYLLGDWSVFMGQAFRFSPGRHVLPAPIPIPPHAPLFMTFDWGYSRPFSIGWWWVDRNRRLYRFHEWYGWNGLNENAGAQMLDRDIAAGIRRIEDRLAHHYQISFRNVTRLCDPTCFNREPPSHGAVKAEPGPSTAEVFEEEGIVMEPGNADRKAKIRELRARLGAEPDPPLLLVYPGCKHFIRTIQALQMDTINVEDIDTDGEDHVYDEACHVVMANPLGAPEPAYGLTQAMRDFQHVSRTAEEEG